MLLIVKLGKRVIPSMRLGCVSAVGAHHAMRPIFVVKILHIGMPDIGEVIMNKASSLVVVSAPSGCGKDTIIEKVCQRLEGIGVSISCTTREPRPKSDGNYEQHGVDYFFIKRPEFEERICQNGFLEYANNKGDLYGTPRAYVF